MTDESILDVLDSAVASKYRTRALYRMVLRVFGPAQPFKDLLKVEEKYQMVLAGLAKRFDHVLPPDDWHDQLAIPETFIEACEEAIALEREHELLYAGLILKTNDPALRRVLMRMRNVSKINHQRSFQDHLEYARFKEKRASNFYPETFMAPRTFV